MEPGEETRNNLHREGDIIHVPVDACVCLALLVLLKVSDHTLRLLLFNIHVYALKILFPQSQAGLLISDTHWRLEFHFSVGLACYQAIFSSFSHQEYLVHMYH